jgi:hypothetical protein
MCLVSFKKCMKENSNFRFLGFYFPFHLKNIKNLKIKKNHNKFHEFMHKRKRKLVF